MNVDASRSAYQESSSATEEFDRMELRRARFLLRRLRFLEKKISEGGGVDAAGGSGGPAFSEWEVEALEWVLKEIGFIVEKKNQRERKAQ